MYPKLKLSMFCTLSLSHKHFFENMINLKQILWHSKISLRFWWTKQLLSLVIKTCKLFLLIIPELKSAQSYFFKIQFSISFEDSPIQIYNFKIELKCSSRFDVWDNFVICSCLWFCCVSLIMLSITGHILINIFQTEYSPAWKKIQHG